jgi:arylsulfatase A-like enzyme
MSIFLGALQIKMTPWEGGLRGVAVLWSYGLESTPRVSTQLMHVSDWLPTLYTAAGGNPADLQSEEFDGVDQWDALVYNRPSRRDKALLYVDEVLNLTAVRSGQWKLVSGTVWLIAFHVDGITVQPVNFEPLG